MPKPIPALKCPTSDVDPQAIAQLDVYLESWMRGLDIPPQQRQRLIGDGCGTLGAAVFANACSPRHLQLGAQWVATVTIVDEACDRPDWPQDGDHASRWIEADLFSLDRAGRGFLPPHEQAQAPQLRMLRSAKLNLDKIAGTDAADRIHHSMGTALHLHTVEALWRATGQMPTVREYLLCHQVSAYRVAIDLLDAVGGYRLSNQIIAHPAMRRITRTAAQAAGLLNDCYSASWEDEHDFNIIRCLRHERDCNSEEAALAAVELHNQAMADFDDACTALTGYQLAESDLMARFIDDLRALLAGNHAWHLHTTRYTTAQGATS